MQRRRFKGKVVSDKMEKTIVVAVEKASAHPVYKRQVRKTKRFKAHDELGAKVGDEVVIEETRPLSSGKRWRVIANAEAQGVKAVQKGKRKSAVVKNVKRGSVGK